MIETLSLTLGALLAAIISGATGFGFALAATAMWSFSLEPRLVAVLALVFTTVLGAYALATLPASAVRLWVGSLLLTYGSYRLLRHRAIALQMSPSVARTGDLVVGFIGGVFGGLGGLSGFLPVLWCGLRDWDKRSQRALIQSYILFANFLSMAWIGRLVGVDAAARGNILLGLPFVILGGWLGLRLFARFDTPTFNRIVLWVIAGCGLVLVLNR